MARDFFHRDIELFIDHRFDWERYLRLRGAETSVADEIDTYRTILRTTGEICADIEAGAVEHWHEEVRLENGRVIIPRHITAGYEKLRGAGLLCLTLGAEYGGSGLPVLLQLAHPREGSRAAPRPPPHPRPHGA